MEDLNVATKVEEGIGFRVAGHNYGRLDRLKESELDTIERLADAIIRQAQELLDGIALERAHREEATS